MAVQPLNKTKIIKKVKKHANRFHSDRYFRVGVSTELPAMPGNAASIWILTRVCRHPGEPSVVSTPL